MTNRFKKTLAANTALTLIAPTKALRGVRILNWTASPVFLALGTVEGGAVPVAGAPCDVVPAAAGGLPGQYEAPVAPVQGVAAIGATAGDLSVEVW